MTRSTLFTLIFIALLSYGACPEAATKHEKPAKSATKSTTKASAPEQGARTYAQRPEVMAQVDDIANRRNLDLPWTRDTLSQARYLPSVAKLMLPAAVGQKKDWGLYRSRFIDPVRIAAGVKFWQTHAKWLEQAEQTYGVPPEIIVGIIGVETIYGRQTGTFRVIDALATLAFDFPTAHPRAATRQAFFRDELEQFLSLMSRSGGDPLAVRGSYAGAIGMPQFMPSSIMRYAVDFDGDGRIDLTQSVPDVIGSVANYFKGHGWEAGMPTHYAVQFDAATLDLDALLAPDILPTFSLSSMTAKGATPELPDGLFPGKLALIELQMGKHPPVYVAGTENFYVITRYNWSSYYAMAVLDLGREVASAMKR